MVSGNDVQFPVINPEFYECESWTQKTFYDKNCIYFNDSCVWTNLIQFDDGILALQDTKSMSRKMYSKLNLYWLSLIGCIHGKLNSIEEQDQKLIKQYNWMQEL